MHERRLDHGWAPPSGAVKPGEDVRSALKRELHESSLEIEITRFVGLYSDPTFQIVQFPTGETIHFVTSLFVCRAASSQFEGSEEGIAWGWHAPEELPEPLLPYAERWLDDTIAENAQPVVQ